MKKRIFITGSEGFIGSHLVESLLKKKYKLTCLVLYNSFSDIGWLNDISHKNKNLNVVLGDIRDTELMTKLTSNQDIIVNLAALIGIPYSYVAPRSYFETNVFGLMNLLEASKKNKVKRIIQVSTSEVYGSPKYVPIDENHPYSAQSPYAASKIAADQLALSYYNSFNLPVSIIRPFNTFGPRQSLRAIIPSLVTQYNNNKDYIKVGSTFPIRDLTFVDDTVEGLVKFIECKQKLDGKIINLGTNSGISVNQLIKKISKIIRVKKKIIIDKRRIRPKNSEVNRLISSNKFAKRTINWSPNFTKKNIDVALKITIDWFKDKKNLQKYKSENYTI